jgi:hypothetical protein
MGDIQDRDSIQLARDYFRHEYLSSWKRRSGAFYTKYCGAFYRKRKAKSRSFDCESALPRSGRKCKCSRLSAQDDNKLGMFGRA